MSGIAANPEDSLRHWLRNASNPLHVQCADEPMDEWPLPIMLQAQAFLSGWGYGLSRAEYHLEETWKGLPEAIQATVEPLLREFSQNMQAIVSEHLEG